MIVDRYADRPNAYWTGFFTSRPGFKHYVRVLSGYYVVCHQNHPFLEICLMNDIERSVHHILFHHVC